MNTAFKVHRPLLINLGRALFDIFIDGRHADKVIERYLKANSKWGSRDRKFFSESVYEVVRHYYRYCYLAGILKPQQELDFVNIWAHFAYEKWGLRDVSGVTFNLHAYHTRLQQLKSEPIWLQESWPEWLDQYMINELPDEWPALRSQLNQTAPVDLRTNTLKLLPTQLRDSLLLEGVVSDLIPGYPEGLVLSERKNVFITNSFKKGFFEVQDRSSQRIAHILDPQPGERICDACAGAGGKSLHIAALMKNKGRILSMDVVDWKLKELRTRALRAGVTIIETRLIEGTKTVKRQECKFDRVLLDVPCSGLGVVRRNPDTKWKLTQKRLTELLELQAYILDFYSRMVKPGGVLVYATCSVIPQENERQVERFLNTHQDNWRMESMWSSRLDSGDGFFAAKIIRKEH
jgi:16S rRNA (cytosine967-C5)-methyltransferase